MSKYKLANNEVVDLSTYTPDESIIFLSQQEEGYSEVTEDFQNGAAETSASATPINDQALNGDSTLDPGLLDSQNKTPLTVAQKKKLPYDVRAKLRRENDFTQERLDEVYNSEDEWFAEDTEKGLDAALLTAGGTLARIPTFLNELAFSTVGALTFSNEERARLDAMPPELRQIMVNSLGANPSMSNLANKGLEYYEEARKEAAAIQETMTQWETGIGQDYANGNWSRATARTISAAIGALPSVAQAMVPYVGIASIALGAGAEASADAQRRGEGLNLKTMGYAATVGVAEGGLEAITKGIAGRMFKTLNGVGKEVIKKKVSDVALNIAKEYGLEGLSESGTLIATKLADYAILGDKKAFENTLGELVDTFLIGGMMGGSMGSAGGSATLLGQVAQSKKIKKDLKNTDYSNLAEAYKDTETTKGLDAVSLNPSTGKFLNAELKEKVQSGEMTIEESTDIKSNFANSQKAAITVSKTNISKKETAKSIDLLQEKNKLNEEIKAIDDKALTGEQSLRVEAIDAELKSVVEMGNKEAFVAKKKQAAEKITKQLGVTTENFTDDSAFQTRADELLDEGGKEKASAAYGLAIEKDGKTVILINDKAALGDNVYTTDQHEVLHPLLKQTFANSPDASYAFGGALLKELNSDNVSAKNSIVTKKLNQYLEAGISSVDSMEEVMNFTSEALSDGSLEFNATALTKLTDIFRGILRKAGVNIKFNDGKDVLNFIRDYNKTFSKGKELNLGMLKSAKEGIKGSLTKQTREESIEKIEDKELKAKVEANKDIKESDAKQSKSDKAKAALDVIKFEDLKKTKAQKIIVKELPGMVRAQVFNQYSGLGDQKIQEFTDEVVERIYLAGETEKWGSKKGIEMESKGSLYGFLNGRIFLRIKDVVFNEYKRDPYSRLYFSGEDGNQFDALENAADVAVEDVKQVAEKPKYKNLLESKLLSSDVLRSISDKVLRTVRTLKSRMDAKVSLNKTITPLVAEIKKDMGKQADIDLKKAMGSKKGGELESFLLKNKKAILENMTTTWLMGAMPGAIQKQVDGKFTSDWQGKKIDRETVNTNNAGKTSGAEIVRRLPNVAQNISDEVFLSYILDAKGNPIRGRKESLAKALAEEIAFDIFSQQLKNPESDISKAFENNQEAKGVALANDYLNKVKKDIERGTVKFSLKNNIFIENQNFLKVNTEFAAENKQWKAAVRAFGLEPLNMKTEADRVLYRGWIVGELSKYLPKTFFENNGTFTGTTKSIRNEQNEVIGRDYGGNYAFLKNEDLNETLNKISNFAKPSKSIEAAVKKQTYSNIEAKLNDADFNAFQDLKIDGLKDIFLALEAMMKNNPANIPFVAAMLSSTSAYQGHFIRVAAPIRFYTIGIDGKFVEEHTLPASLTAKYLFKLAVQGKINESFSDIKKNYFQGALARSYDDRLKGVNIDGKPFNYKETPPEGWVLTDNIWARYFNNNVAGNDGGVLPQNIMLANGISAIKKFGINSSGYKIPKAIADVNYKKLAEFQAKQKVITSEANKPTVKLSMKLNEDFNDMLERNKGVTSAAEFSRVVAKRRGASKGRFKVWMPSSLNDFKGLTSYTFAGKGRQGDADQRFFKENLIDPYFNGIAAIETSRQTMKDDFVALNKMFKPVVKSLGTLIESGDYTNDQAIRVYLWTKAGFEIPGLSKRDQKKLLVHINNNPDLQAYADGALLVSKQPNWIKPGAFWDAQTILSDLGNMTEKVGRKEYIAEFIENADVIFSETNLNKIEALYGTRHRDALEDILYRMKNGTNRPAGASKNQNIFNNWVNNSVGAIMFFNRRSALLQTLSTVNFLNWSDNNPAKAAAAFANQPQFWKDFATIFNSAKLKQRRSGLKSDINEAEIASAVKGSKNKATAALSWLLKKGFLPTQWADSFAIASGGATFYRNRVNSLLEKSGFKKPQVIFLTGAAGSGKTTAAKNFGKNWVIINKDVEMEALMKEAGLPSDLNKLTREQIGEWRKIQEQASKNALAEIKKLKEQGKNIIIDDTGSSEATISRLKRELEKSGYESKMLLLGTSLEQSLERNKARKQRTLTDVTVKNSFEALMGNKKRYKEVFKDNFIEATDGKISDNLISKLTGKISRKDAEAQAFEDFSEISEETQQSGDPALISSDQASVVGRLFLAFQNTPIQLNRSIKKSAQDIYNRRRMSGQSQMQSDFSNISKILYYGAIQNIIFTALSNALFALLPGFDDDEPTEKELQELEEKKLARMANGIVDTTLKGGFGLPGAVLATIKNVIMEYNKQDEKGFKADHGYTIIQAINLAPPIGSKIGKIYSGIKGAKFNERVIEKRGFSVKAFGKFNISPKFSVWGKYIEGTTNLPLGRAVDEINAIVEAFDTRNTVMQRIALGLGWRTWDIGVENEENDLVDTIEEGIEKRNKANERKNNKDIIKQALNKK